MLRDHTFLPLPFLAVGVLLLLLNIVDAADKTTKVGDTTVKILGRSGKMIVTQAKRTIYAHTVVTPGAITNETLNATTVTTQANSTRNTTYTSNITGAGTPITITMDALRETDAGGNTIGTSGSDKHSFNTFASQDFTFGSPETASYQGLGCTRVDFTATILTVATLKVSTLIFTEKGTILNDGEESTVDQGTMKFSITIDNWLWCTGSGATQCTQGQTPKTGAFIDIDIAMKGSKDATAKAPKAGKPVGNQTKDYDLGDGAVLAMSNRVQVDGVWRSMPAGYPKLTIQGANNIYTVRLPKGAGQGTKIVYDPTVSGALETVTSETVLSPNPTPTPASTPAKAATITVVKQSMKMAIAVSSYTGALKALVEKGYGAVIGAYDTAAKTYKTGYSIKSSTARRASCTVTYETTVPSADAATVISATATVSPTTMQASMNTVKAAEGAYAAVSVPAVNTVTPATITTVTSGSTDDAAGSTTTIIIIILAVMINI